MADLFYGFFGKYKNKDLIYKLRNGTNFLIRSDSFERNIFNEIWVYEQYTPKRFEINRGDVVVDIGANVGIFSVYAASKASEGEVYAFEPVRENFERLLKNIEINNLKNVKAYNLGISNKTGIKNIFISSTNTGGHSLYSKVNEESQVKEKIKLISLKKVFSDNKIKRINFLKCDCEGAEYEILFPAKELLKKVDKISMEVHYLNERKNVFTMKNFLEENGFKVKIFPEYENGVNMLYAKNLFFSNSDNFRRP